MLWSNNSLNNDFVVVVNLNTVFKYVDTIVIGN